MGKSYLFECPKCGHKAKVAGGPDNGIDVWIQTIHCRDCRKLYDAVLRLRVPVETSFLSINNLKRRGRNLASSGAPPLFEKVLGQLPFPSDKVYEWTEFPARCPISAFHKTQPWKDPGKCPCCGVFLEKNGLPFRVWD